MTAPEALTVLCQRPAGTPGSIQRDCLRLGVLGRRGWSRYACGPNWRLACSNRRLLWPRCLDGRFRCRGRDFKGHPRFERVRHCEVVRGDQFALRHVVSARDGVERLAWFNDEMSTAWWRRRCGSCRYASRLVLAICTGREDRVGRQQPSFTPRACRRQRYDRPGCSRCTHAPEPAPPGSKKTLFSDRTQRCRHRRARSMRLVGSR